MHILLAHRGVIPAVAYGGTERVIWDLGRALIARGHRVTYLVAAGSRCEFAPVIALNDALPWDAQIPPDVDLVHFQFDPGAGPSRPWLMTEHGNSKLPVPFPLNTVFVSANHAARHGCNQYVLNGLDWSSYGEVDLAAPRSRFHFLGKAAWRVKNVQGAIDVAGRAGVRLDVLGGHRLNLKRGLRLTLSPRVRFHGMVGGEEKLGLLKRSRGLIMPVRWHEPFGLAVIESLYCGAAVFATPYGALPELVTPECGTLSAGEEALADAVRNARFDPRECNARAVRHFSADRMAQGYVDKYERVLAGEMLNSNAPRMTGAFDGLEWRRA